MTKQPRATTPTRDPSTTGRRGRDAEAHAVLGAALVTDGAPARLCVTGESMRPTLRPGDWITVVAAPARLEVGCLVLARRSARPLASDSPILKPVSPRHQGPDELICHRLVEQRMDDRGQPEVVLVGDRYGGVDRIPKGDVWGHVSTLEQDGRIYRFDSAATRRLGRLLAAMVRLRLACEQHRGSGPLPHLLHLLCRALLLLGHLVPGSATARDLSRGPGSPS